MTSTKKIIETTEKYGAHNYHPLPIVISKAEGVWVYDPEGKKYLDFLSAYSALNHGHRHPRIIKALKEQADRCTLTSRAFHNDQLGAFTKELAELCGMTKVLPMNSGAEAVETALKAARKWAYTVKGVPLDQAEIITCANNFHGRTISVVSFSTEESYRKYFGPFTPGFKTVPFGDARAVGLALTTKTAAVLVEPVQGEGGVIFPPGGYLKELRDLCTKNKVLLMLDEIQTGLGRTGKLFAYQWEGIKPDLLIIGKALGGGILPISAVVSNDEILGVFEPGEHGSTFGGNPLACAVAREALRVLVEEKLAERSLEMGEYFLGRLRTLKNPHIKDLRGRGLFIGLELDDPARPYCEKLMNEGLLCKETHERVIRFAPPLIIEKADLDWAFARVKKAIDG